MARSQEKQECFSTSIWYKTTESIKSKESKYGNKLLENNELRHRILRNVDAFILDRKRAKSLHLQGIIAGILDIIYKIETEHKQL